MQKTTCRQCERAKAQGSAIKEALSGLPPNCHIHISGGIDFCGGGGNMLPSSGTRAITYR